MASSTDCSWSTYSSTWSTLGQVLRIRLDKLAKLYDAPQVEKVWEPVAGRLLDILELEDCYLFSEQQKYEVYYSLVH